MSRLFSRLRRASRDQRGQALVEMALVLPILLILVFTLLVGGSLMLRYYAVTVSAREGARAAALGDPSPQTRIRNVMSDYNLDPNKAGTVISVYDCHGGKYKCARVRYVADTIVPGYVFGGTSSGLPLESVAAFRKEGP